MERDMNKHNLFTSSFKAKLLVGGKLLVLLALILAFLLSVMPQYSGNYMASLMDKMHRLESLDGAKLVLIGDSNLAFSMNSEELEAAFGLPVVNMGLHGGIGNEFHERMAHTNVHAGDIYIVCHTNYCDDDSIGDANVVWLALEDHFALWRLLRPQDLWPMVKAYPVYLRKCLDLWAPGYGNQDAGEVNVYSRSCVNEYGDIEWQDEGLDFDFAGYQSYPPAIGDITVARLNALNDTLTAQGATLLIAGYPIADTSARAADADFDAFEESLRAQLHAPVISHYTDYIYPCEDFFNSSFHLNNVGKELRTQQLISDLTAYWSAHPRNG